ncbi:glycine zipper domain-containing protein [Botrimarina hoheduenensis]|uniref:Glycine zipper domain-containing protein n=1 Tax=Botrimarina hoheduenensis TaxID=2528000 RepID=A0A5C5VVA6_9BACT|nr:glycine zipper domain-containing protein [Botrimarina hoheduenensis]TWT41599.1 hypothetical protein Pla111_29760 [Botrimarina hoheduenensis]
MLAPKLSRLLLVVLGIFVAAPSVDAQYYYAPSRDYYRNDTAEGTVVGGGLGAITGALIGGSEGKSPEGALIGGAVGAIAGNLFGRSKDAADRQQANAGYAATNAANYQAAQQAVTNYDLAQMTQAGLSEAVVVGAIQQRGARLDLSPQGLIQLKQAGVSDAVLMAAQRATATGPQGGYLPPAPASVLVERPSVYFLEPAPRVYFRAGYGHHHRHCW